MKITNTKMTKEEARQATSQVGVTYPDTPHNRKMVANRLREVIAELHNAEPKYV